MPRRRTMSIGTMSLMALLVLETTERRSSWAAATAGLPDVVQSALESNEKALSPLSIECELTRTSDLPRASVLELLKETNALFEPRTTRFIWQAEHFYWYERFRTPQVIVAPDRTFKEDPSAPYLAIENETTFDGKNRYTGSKPTNNTGNPVLVIDTLDNVTKQQPTIRFAGCDYLYEAGFRVPEHLDEYKSKRPPRSLLLYLIDQGATVVQTGRENIDGLACTFAVLRANDREFRFSFDDKKGYAVRRRVERKKTGELIVQSECLDFRQIGGSDVWMPWQVKVSRHTWYDVVEQPLKSVLLNEVYKLSDINKRPVSDEQFVLNYSTPGSYIADSTLPNADTYPNGRISYRVPAKPEDLDDVLRAASNGYQPRRGISLFLLGNLLAGFVLTAAAIVYRRKRRHAERIT